MIVIAVIIYATWVPKPIDPDDIPPIPHIDKLIHDVMMGGLAGAIMFDYRRDHRNMPLSHKVVNFITIAVAIFCIVDELVQGFLPIGRPSDFYDLLADWFGVAIAYVTAPYVVNRIFAGKRK